MRVHTALRSGRRALGAVLLVVAYVPVHRLLGPERAGPPGVATVAVADSDQALLRMGTVLVLLVGGLLAAVLPVRRVAGALERLGRGLARPSARNWAGGVFVASLSLGLGIALGVHRGLPRLLDEMAQLLHARVFTAGALALPLPDPAAAFLIQNSVVTAAGWSSVYPPGHTGLLALGLAAGAAWAVGPVLLAVGALFTFLTLERLFPERPATVRLASMAVVASPFLLLLGSGYLSHGSAAAAAAVAFWAAVRAWQGRAPWALLAGASLGFMVTSRPWSGLALGGFLVAGTWCGAWWREGRSRGWIARRLGLAAVGGSPFAAALCGIDLQLFGSPARLGYEVAFGPAHGLGFHPDPWGNLYGLREAIGYSAADLSTLGLRLLETPLSAVGLVGLFLLLAPRLSFQTRLLLGWALVPVLANALYWHHGQHMGPRMLFESAPAWAALTVLAATAVVSGLTDPGLPGGETPLPGSSLAASTALWSVLVSLAMALALLVPSRLHEERWSPDGLARSTLPAYPLRGEEPSLILVHGTWANRVASRLAAMGMRRDSVETAIRQNDLCRVQLYADARARGEGTLPALDLEPRPGTPTGLRSVELPSGVRVRLAADDLPPECLREIRSDRYGVVELAPLLWQLPFPGTDGPPLLARDLGPEGNRPLVDGRPASRVVLLGMTRPGEPPRLIPYDDAMRELWGSGP